MACISKRRGRLVLDFYDQQGRRRWKTLKEGTTMRDADRELTRIKNQIDKGSYVAPSKVPGFSQVAKEWLRGKKLDVRHQTYATYRGHIENHLEPHYGITQVSKISYDSIEEFIQDQREAGVIVPTLCKVLITFGAIMGYAVKKRYIAHNPLKDIKKPKDQGEQKEEIKIFTPREIRALIDAAPDLKHETLFTTAVLTGMRLGEILGLKWDDIDWISKQIHVKRTFNHKHFYEPKSTHSKRKIDMAPELVRQLKEWQLACPPNELDLVFPNRDGRPMNDVLLRRGVFKPALKKAGISKAKFHGLRHTYASVLLDLGENIQYVQKQLGHSSVKITLDIYGHLLQDTNQDSATRLGAAIFGENGSKVVAKNENRL